MCCGRLLGTGDCYRDFATGSSSVSSVFRITRRVADRLLDEAAAMDEYFTERFDATQKRSICPKVKLLMGGLVLATLRRRWLRQKRRRRWMRQRWLRQFLLRHEVALTETAARRRLSSCRRGLAEPMMAERMRGGRVITASNGLRRLGCRLCHGRLRQRCGAEGAPGWLAPEPMAKDSWRV